ncbi:MAG: 23S rRNA (adenine(2030)-N(6))-methyltransferase RlmJ [Culturomica sp.]|jgi:16S rRNA (guanine(966)-N(2))-methyltransferase RsmD|nr:23S rRNA (adenine(2030)-N(6))-methyltransferase RlmJ [Culturomica sp.]
MRIISGTHKGRQIIPDKNFTARPTTDFAKENIFNVIANIIDIDDCMALDLFSGTGSISYELASRGAKEVISVELNYNHYAFIKATALQLNLRQIKVYKNDAFAALKKLAKLRADTDQKFDLIFADPPYQLLRIKEIPDAIFDNDLLATGGLAIIEHPSTVDYSSHPFFSDHRKYGSVNFSIFKK